MELSYANIVAGFLMHIGGLDQADRPSQIRTIDSISPIHRDWGIWQACDNVLGASWIVAIGCEEIHQLIATRNDGTSWRIYKPSSVARIIEVNDTGKYDIVATVASFHDTRHGASPPALLRVGEHYIYRNISGYSIPIKDTLALEVLELNNIQA
jgi:hypothetical protein